MWFKFDSLKLDDLRGSRCVPYAISLPLAVTSAVNRSLSLRLAVLAMVLADSPPIMGFEGSGCFRFLCALRGSDIE